MALTISHRCQNIAPSLTLQIDTRAKEMAASGMDVVGFGAGEPDFPTPAHICDAAREAHVPQCYHFPDKEGAKALLRELVRPGTTVLVKASRGMAFEEITGFLKSITEEA